MPVTREYEDAFVHYLTKFPTLASLGTGNPPADWKAELDLVAATALDPVLATQTNVEGGNVSGLRGFEQSHKLRALHAVRAKRDSTYVNPYTLPMDIPITAGRRLGIGVIL